eukprot:TRINITY_DN5506_c0_g1_i1.p1 TRINITY_DN5506_c0_g1~~TRINITY_DN5506_c0_g1_i1.p1  ORF type:complete len:132 (+),score=42.65 TRINITY_DN5506_c0_g1_i1:81-476(+)
MFCGFLLCCFFFFFFKQKTAYEMQRGLVGSEMCIRDSQSVVAELEKEVTEIKREALASIPSNEIENNESELIFLQSEYENVKSVLQELQATNEEQVRSQRKELSSLKMQYKNTTQVKKILRCRQIILIHTD